MMKKYISMNALNLKAENMSYEAHLNLIFILKSPSKSMIMPLEQGQFDPRTNLLDFYLVIYKIM